MIHRLGDVDLEGPDTSLGRVDLVRTHAGQGDEPIEDIGGPGVEWLAIIAARYES